MKRLLLIFNLGLSLYSFSQDSLSVLFIGNSYTYVNDLPSVTNSLTTSLGDILTVNSQTQGGATFATHVGNLATYQKIHSKPWDFVVLQGQSQELSFPTSQVNTESLPYIQQLADSIHTNHYCSQIELFMTWGRQYGDPQWDSISTYNGMQERLTNAAVRMADSIESSISPVGVAWKYVRDNYPSINLYSSDGSHPSFEGTYLAACTFYASLYRKSPVGAAYVGSLNSIVAGILQNVASLTVLDSLDRWNLHELTNQTIADYTNIINNNTVSFTNVSEHGTLFEWDFNDGQFSTETNPVHTFIDNGIYNVQLIASDTCSSDTTTYQILINELGISSHTENSFLLKNLPNDQFLIENIYEEDYQISIFDMNGQLLKEKSTFEPKQIIDLSTFNNGFYIILLSNNTVSQPFKVVKN